LAPLAACTPRVEGYSLPPGEVREPAAVDIGVPFRDLGPVDATAAVAMIEALPEDAWRINRFRQEVLAASAHRQTTRAILLKYNWVPYMAPWRRRTMAEVVKDWRRQEGAPEADVVPEIESENQFGAVNVFPQWRAMRAVIEPLVAQAIAPIRTEAGVVNRIALVELAAGGKIDPHIDGQEMAALAHRVHIPLISPPGVEYKIGGKKFRMQVGRAYDFNNRLQHSVRNKSKRPRINILVDYLPNPGVKVANPFGRR
jgi:hypothetical protein